MKKVFNFLFPMFGVFNKKTLSLLTPLFDRLLWALKFYSLTLSIPIAVSIVNVAFCGILGFDSVHGFWGNFYHIWVGFYFTGSFLGTIAWKWQLFLFLVSFLFTFVE
jgi:hypothetical protein